MKRINSKRGYTLIEIMMVVSILGVVIGLGSTLLTGSINFYITATARSEIQRDMRTCFDLIFQELKQAQSATTVIDTPPGQGNYSRISFTTINGVAMQFYQNGNQLIMVTNGHHSIISTNLLYLAFTFPSSYNPSMISVSLTMSKNIQKGGRSIIQASINPIKIMN